MSQERVSFQFIGNDRAIDFVNTLVADKGEPFDTIDKPYGFDGWLKEAGISATRLFTDKEMGAVHTLRKALKAVLDARITGSIPSAEDLDVIDSYVSSYSPNLKLTYDGDQFKLIDRTNVFEPAIILGKLAQGAAELLTSTSGAVLKSCSNPSCVLVYKDISRGSKRRWCSMKTCGNRAKAATFREDTG